MSTMQEKFTMISDPGHGWLEVRWTSLRDVGLNPTDFTPYSYRSGNTFYLEEDCDAGKFVAAYRRKYGRLPTIVERHEDPTPIRNYRPIYGGGSS